MKSEEIGCKGKQRIGGGCTAYIQKTTEFLRNRSK